MNRPSELDRIREWLIQIATTAEAEIDCDALETVLERVLAVVDRAEDIAEMLPGVAVHLEHCPECRDWYDSLVAFCAHETSAASAQ